ncbi:pentatricopeptide repeat-containing protein [Tanacetum coccineum]
MLRLNRSRSGVVDPLLKQYFKGNCSIIKTPFSNSQLLGLGFHSCSILFSNSCSNGKSVNDTKLNEALNVFNKMTHERPLPWADEFIRLLEDIKRHDMYFYKKGVVSFKPLFDGLILENRIYEAKVLFKQLVKDELCQPDTVLYNTIIKALCSHPFYNSNVFLASKMMGDALKFLREMVSEPDVVTYNSLISCLCEHRWWSQACLLLTQMVEEKDISPDLETFNILVNSFCNEGRIEEAHHAIYMMQERGIAPNIVTFNALIQARCSNRELTKARLLFDSMVSRDLAAPDAATYSILLSAYCDAIKMDQAMLIYREMNERGFKPNHDSYSIMIRKLFSVARSGEACKVLDDMRAQGQMLNAFTYFSILNDLINMGRFEEALSLFHFVGDDGKLNSDISVFYFLINAAFVSKKPHIATELFEDLSVKGMKPDLDTYTAMIAGFCGEGLMKDAKHLFLKMEESGIPPIALTYNSLIQLYLKSKCYDDVKTLLHKMAKTYHRLDVLTFSWLQDSVAAGMLDSTTLKLIDKLKEEKENEEEEDRRRIR